MTSLSRWIKRSRKLLRIPDESGLLRPHRLGKHVIIVSCLQISKVVQVPWSVYELAPLTVIQYPKPQLINHHDSSNSTMTRVLEGFSRGSINYLVFVTFRSVHRVKKIDLVQSSANMQRGFRVAVLGG